MTFHESDPQLRPISPTRENISAMAHMQQTELRTALPSAPQPNETLLTSAPDILYESLVLGEERRVGLFHKNQLVAFIEMADWVWGHQKAFESEFDITDQAVTGRYTLHDLEKEDTERLEGDPLGIMALYADEIRAAELGGAEPAMARLIDVAIRRARGRELRMPLLSPFGFDNHAHVYNDPARRAAESREFESAAKLAKRGRLHYELFIRASR